MPKLVDHNQRRAEFEEAACAEIARVGIEAARLADIAALVGVTTGSLIHYYPDKRTLLLAALDHAVQRMERRMRTRLERKLPDVFGFFCEALPITEKARIDNVVWYHFWAFAIHDRTVRIRQRRYHRRWIATVEKILEGLRERHEIALVGPVSEAAEGLAASINGLMIRAILDPSDWPKSRQQAQLERAIQQLLPRAGCRELRLG